jgi:hypothetical protein
VIRQSAKLAVAIGLALLVSAMGAAFAVGSSPPVKHPAVDPAVGGLTTIVQVHVVVGGEGADSNDELEVTAPSGTPCANATAGLVVMDNVAGPHEDGSGPVTLYIGPGAAEEYPAMAGYNAYNLVGPGSGLARWCPGTYTGEIVYQQEPGPPVVRATFRFRISATKHAAPAPPPAVAHELKPVTVFPDRGLGGTIFAVRYRADAASYDIGDVIDVNGPKHSGCRGGLVRLSSERPDWTAGPLTAHIGPVAGGSVRWGSEATVASPARDNGSGAALRRWCPGTYKGTILHEHYAKFTVIARFGLHVAR